MGNEGSTSESGQSRATPASDASAIWSWMRAPATKLTQTSDALSWMRPPSTGATPLQKVLLVSLVLAFAVHAALLLLVMWLRREQCDRPLAHWLTVEVALVVAFLFTLFVCRILQFFSNEGPGLLEWLGERVPLLAKK